MASPTATEVVVSSAAKRFAGVASGLEHTAGMFGTSLGTALFGTLILLRVGHVLPAGLAARGVPAPLAAEVNRQAGAAAQGVAPIPAGAPPGAAARIAEAVHSAYLNGLHVAMFAGAVGALLGAVIAWLFIRRHEMAPDQETARAGKASPQAAA
jgi:hypothetical protein